MRDFFINSLEKIVTVIILLMVIGVVLSGFGAMFNAQGGLLAGLAVWVFGGIYVLIMGGMLYLALGIYDNTRRTAAAVEALSAKT